MTGLQRFSLQGLRRFQNILFGLGFLLLPLLFFADSLGIKWFLSIAFLSIFWGFWKAEKIAGQKPQKVKRRTSQKLLATRQECEDMLVELEEMFRGKGYSSERMDNSMLDILYRQLHECKTGNDYHSLKGRIQKQKFFVSGLKQKQKTFKQEKRKERPVVSSSPMSKHFQALGLPEGTTDMVHIKKAYKQLIKQHHPDLNHSKEAGTKTVELNLAYEQLKQHIEVS
jgi:DnaJ-domain-containing protein 1